MKIKIEVCLQNVCFHRNDRSKMKWASFAFHISFAIAVTQKIFFSHKSCFTLRTLGPRVRKTRVSMNQADMVIKFLQCVELAFASSTPPAFIFMGFTDVPC